MQTDADNPPAVENAAEGTKPTPTPMLPYVLPFGLFLLLTATESYFPKPLYPVVYMAKAAIIAVVLGITSKTWRHEIRGDVRAIGIGVLAGLIGLPLWLGVDAITPHLSFLGARVAYNPFVTITDPGLRMAFLVVRFCGLALLVPIMEEVFWRSFLLRWVTDQDRWYTLPLGTFSGIALAVVSVLFGAAHPEYLAGIVFALLMAGLLRTTRSLLACIVAHAVTNLTLGIYVVAYHAWKYW